MSRSLGVLTLDLIARTGGFESGLDKAARVADRKTREMERAAKARAKAIEGAFNDLGKKLAAAWGALKLADNVKQTVDLADSLSKLSQKTGVAVSDLSALSYAAKLNDATLEDLGTGLRGLSQKMMDAAKGSQEQAAAFRALGISVTDSSGKLRPVADVLGDMADRFSMMEDGAGKAAIAQKLLGDAGVKLIPMLNGGTAGLAEMRAEAEKLGAVMGDDFARASADFNDNVTRLSTGINSLMIPALNEVLPKLNEFINLTKTGGLGGAIGASLSNAFSGKSLREQIKQTQRDIEELEKQEASAAALAKSGGAFGIGAKIGAAAVGTSLSAMQSKLEALKALEREAALLGSDYGNEGRGLTTPTAGKTAAPIVPGKAPTGPKAPAYTDPLADAARAYASTLESLQKQQQAAETSAWGLNSAQQELLAVMTDPAWLQMPESWRLAVAEQGAYAIAAEQAAAEQQRLNDLLAATPTAQLEQSRATMQFLAEAFEKGKISAQQFEEAASAALGNLAPAGEQAKDTFIDLATVANDGARQMASAFTGFFTGQKKNIGEMLAQFLKATGEMIIQAMMLKAIQAGMGALGIPGFANGGVPKANALGGVYNSPSLAAFEGQVVSRPTLFKFANGGNIGLMGEAGAEAILPLKRDKSGKLGVSLSGGGGGGDIINVSVTVNETGTRDEKGSGNDQQTARDLGRMIADVATQVIVREKRPGGLLYGG